jgi:hypothetical protein
MARYAFARRLAKNAKTKAILEPRHAPMHVLREPASLGPERPVLHFEPDWSEPEWSAPDWSAPDWSAPDWLEAKLPDWATVGTAGADGGPPSARAAGPAVQAKLAASDVNDPLEREAPMDLDSRIRAAVAGGEPLPPSTKTFMESEFGRDFSAVRVHRDGAAARLAAEIGARALTSEQDVFFASGEFRPDTREGSDLIAHELAHVVQQGGSPPVARVQRQAAKEAASECNAADNGGFPLIFDRWLAPPRPAINPVGFAQRKLNLFLRTADARASQLSKTHPKAATFIQTMLSRMTATKAPENPGDALDVDCKFGVNTTHATLAFQAATFPDASPDVAPEGQSMWDGRIGAITWPKLDSLSAAPSAAPGPVPSSPVPAAPGPKPGPKPGVLPAPVSYQINAFIPDTLKGAFPAPGGPFRGRTIFRGPPHPFHRNSCFETDDRSFSTSPTALSRVRLVVNVDPRTALGSAKLDADPTFEVDCATGALKCLKVPSPSGGLKNQVVLSSTLILHQVEFAAGDPCVFGAPNLVIRGNVFIDVGARKVIAQLNSTLFPAFEMYVTSGPAPATVFTLSPVLGSVFALFIPSFNPVGGSAPF